MAPYTYNKEGQIYEILVSYYNTSFSYRKITIYYQNGLPVSGKTNYDYVASSKEINPPSYIDSISYKTLNGQVSEIKYFDHKTYSRGKLVSTNKDTTGRYIFSYAGNNLVKVNTGYSETEYTYGSKNGILSASRLKFVLNHEDSPILHSSNELISSIANKPSSNWNKRTYKYTYYKNNFPKSASVTVSSGNGQPSWSYDLVFVYQ